jgi:DNA repair ATPase RecN
VNRIRLKSLILTGSTVEPASVVFNENLTVIYGASDTGKTYIARAIDFMLGATKDEENP